MHAKLYEFEVITSHWLTPSVIHLVLHANKRLSFESGQFLSVYIPHSNIRRAYSFASPYIASDNRRVELCIKVREEGTGARFICGLKMGDRFKGTAPYGDFVLRNPEPGQSLCFIGTGTGIGPIRSMILGAHARSELGDRQVSCFYGVRKPEDVLFRNFSEGLGVRMIHCYSKAPAQAEGEFHGRVTDYLRVLQTDRQHNWPWHTTQFYLCGNNAMIHEVRRILINSHGISEKNIHQEAFFTQADQAEFREAA